MKSQTTADEVRFRRRLFLALVLGAQLSGPAAPFAHADIAVTGDTNPADASFWTGGGDAETDGTIGLNAGGTLLVDDGSVLDLDQGVLGHDVDVIGSATFATAAQWLLGNDLEIGHDGIGFLNIFSGSNVTAGDDVYIGYNEGSQGTVLVDGEGSLLKAIDNLIVGDDGTANLTIQRGSVMIFALIFAIIICGCYGSYLQSVGNELRMTRRSFNHGRAMALAEAGVELALWRCNSGRLDASDGWTFSADGNALMRVYTSSDLPVLANLGAGGAGKIYLRIDDIASDTPSIISMGRIAEPNGVVTKQIRVELNKNTTS